MTNASVVTPAKQPGLADLATVVLSPARQYGLDQLAKNSCGSAAWKGRKRAEAQGLAALEEIAPRFVVRQLDMRTELTALVELLDTPVPCMTPGATDIHIEQRALLVIQFPEELLIGPIPGTRPVRILEPQHVFHSNVSYGDPNPALCLGASVPRGFPLREMALISYAALTLQSISLDSMDPAGVLNPEAARWWQANASRIPLTAEPFLGWRAAGPSVAGPSPAGRSDEEAES